MDVQERWGWLLGFIPGGDEMNAIGTLNRNELQSMDKFGSYLHRFWLLWNIVQEGSEFWDVEMRAQMVALLERIYRTLSAEKRPKRAAAEIQPIELVGASREGDNPSDRELRQFLRGVFDRLDNALAIEQESDHER